MNNITSILMAENRQDIGLAIVIGIVIVFFISRWLDAVDRWLGRRL